MSDFAVKKTSSLVSCMSAFDPKPTFLCRGTGTHNLLHRCSGDVRWF
jgi:hypothetical protein